MEHANLGEWLAASCKRWNERIAIDDGQRAVSYADLDRLSAELAAELKDGGACANEPVVALVSNKALDWVVALAIWRAGAVMVPVHRTSPAHSFQEMLKRTGARWVVDATGNFEALGGRGAASGARIHKAREAPPAPRPILDAAALIVFTSGSTGQPKGTVISHKAFSGKLHTLKGILQFSPDTRSLLVLQMTFSFGLWVSLLTLINGGALVMREKFDALSILRTLAHDRITTVAMVPTMLRAVFRSPDADIAQALEAVASGETLKQIILGGEPLDALVDERLR
ncbi:MAG: class I adenylate-forming enzyme family protein, partial [Usitatibacter sp.]